MHASIFLPSGWGDNFQPFKNVDARYSGSIKCVGNPKERPWSFLPQWPLARRYQVEQVATIVRGTGKRIVGKGGNEVAFGEFPQ